MHRGARLVPPPSSRGCAGWARAAASLRPPRASSRPQACPPSRRRCAPRTPGRPGRILAASSRSGRCRRRTGWGLPAGPTVVPRSPSCAPCPLRTRLRALLRCRRGPAAAAGRAWAVTGAQHRCPRDPRLPLQVVRQCCCGGRLQARTASARREDRTGWGARSPSCAPCPLRTRLRALLRCRRGPAAAAGRVLAATQAGVGTWSPSRLLRRPLALRPCRCGDSLQQRRRPPPPL
jgi:hypothetical protein